MKQPAESKRSEADDLRYVATRQELYHAACTRPEPCGAHMASVDAMIARLAVQQIPEGVPRPVQNA